MFALSIAVSIAFRMKSVLWFFEDPSKMDEDLIRGQPRGNCGVLSGGMEQLDVSVSVQLAVAEAQRVRRRGCLRGPLVFCEMNMKGKRSVSRFEDFRLACPAFMLCSSCRQP